ncbi:glycosyl transferase family 1 [Scytonema sp. HK-05]|nr:glycosyl transferase family 1 [Scytonema sp. HK-05]
MNTQQQPTIALMLWGHIWEDFYDSIGVSFESFCNEMTGSWQFSYIEALRLAGVRTVIICTSSRIPQPSRFTHSPTGATVCMLPVPKSYLAIRRQMIHPYPSFGGSLEELFGDVQGSRRVLFKVLRQLAPYLTTPLELLAQELRRQGCSAILCQEYEYFRFDTCVLLGHLLHLPVFATFQGTSYDGNRIGRFLRRLTIQTCAGLVIGPQTEIQRVRTRYNLKPTKIGQIFNPIDLGIWRATDRGEARALLGLPANAQVVVWHGRVELQIKGLDVLLDAWERICCERTGEDLRLLLMGTGTDSEKLRQRIAALPIQNVVWVDKFVNDRVEIKRFLSAGDVYAFPSRYEGFPVAPIEAMACGLPVVAAAASGVPDILEGGEASGGLVVPCGDAAAFALALGRVLDNQEWRHELSKRARRRVEEHFSLEVVGTKLREFFFKSGISAVKN